MRMPVGLEMLPRIAWDTAGTAPALLKVHTHGTPKPEGRAFAVRCSNLRFGS